MDVVKTMSSSVVTLISFCFFLFLFTCIGLLSARKKEETPQDYLIASRSVSPWLTALSAVSTNNSGYMFIGLIGFTWRMGLEAIWIAFGWVLGDLLTWFWVHQRVRTQSEDVQAYSVPSLLARSVQNHPIQNETVETNSPQERYRVSRPIQIASALLTLFFLGGYAAAQLKAGSLTLHTLFDWPMWLGSTLGAFMIVAYCLSGGIRASIWTDAAQSVVMIGSITLLVIYCVLHVGGWNELMMGLEKIDPHLIDPVPENLSLGLMLYGIGWVFGGIVTIGQPHILIRFMAIESTQAIKKARVIYFVWYLFFSALVVIIGLYARLILPDLLTQLGQMSPEMASEQALPALSLHLLPALLVGVMLAGLFSATMSTADSQVLSCSAAITQDLFPKWSTSYLASKISTLSIGGLALIIALSASQGVFDLVLLAWAGLGATIGPLLCIRLAQKPLPSWVALSMMGVGLVSVKMWEYSVWSGSIYKAMPGFLIPLVCYPLFIKIDQIRIDFFYRNQ